VRRRQFLGAAALAAGAAAWPAWLRRAFADASLAARAGTGGVLAAALAAARRSKRPLLVLVIPEQEGAKYQRGQAFGEWINGGEDEQIAPLSRCDVVCAPMAEIRRAAPSLAGEPLMVLFRDGRAAALDAPLRYDDDEEWWVERRIATLARIAGNALKGAPPLPAGDGKALRRRPPPGSHWANSSPCGSPTVEGMPDDSAEMYDCGMGHVPAKSRRFLYFFSRTPAQRARDAEFVKISR
jgi:hypothetical protein